MTTENTVFVSNLAPNLDEAGLKSVFSECGSIVRSDFVKWDDNPRYRIEYASSASAMAALRLSGTPLNGRMIQVVAATPTKSYGSTLDRLHSVSLPAGMPPAKDVMPMDIDRNPKARDIAATVRLAYHFPGEFFASDTRGSTATVRLLEKSISCSCSRFSTMRQLCKHLRAVYKFGSQYVDQDNFKRFADAIWDFSNENQRRKLGKTRKSSRKVSCFRN